MSQSNPTNTNEPRIPFEILAQNMIADAVTLAVKDMKAYGYVHSRRAETALAEILAAHDQAVAQARREAEAVAQKERDELGAALKRSIDIMDAFSAEGEGESK